MTEVVAFGTLANCSPVSATMTETMTAPVSPDIDVRAVPVRPLLGPAASAGFGNHAEPFEDGALNLHEHVVVNPDATFFMKAKGDSMHNDGIFDGDLLVVDRSLTARPGHIVVAIINDEFYVKALQRDGASYRFVSANPAYGDIRPGESDVVRIWGVVRASVRQFSV